MEKWGCVKETFNLAKLRYVLFHAKTQRRKNLFVNTITKQTVIKYYAYYQQSGE